MRLSARLVLSHTLVAGILLGALAITSLALVRMTNAVSEIRDAHLASLDADEELHRAAWSIEVSLRHALTACARGDDGGAVHASVALARAGLHAGLAAVSPNASPRIAALATRYASLADRTVEGEVCAGVVHADAQRERVQLDEELTDAWIERLVELHGAMERKEEEIRRTGRRAATAGIGVGVLASLLGVVMAVGIGRDVAAPLRRLGVAARRLGEGDFSAIPQERGVLEVAALSTELERMRGRLAEIDQLKEGFVASVSHELRTPLGRLREALALLYDGTLGELTPRQLRVTGLAREACEREIRLVTALLDLSRMRAGRPLRMEDGSSLDEIIARAVDEERSDAEAAGVVVRVEHEGDAPRLSLDSPLVERAVANLVRNAVSVSVRGQAVRVNRRVTAPSPGRAQVPCVEVAVSDQGPGVPPRAVQELFTAFATHPVPTRAEGGVGLGLALVREIMRAHGGDVSLTRNGADGATFALFFPLQDVSVARVEDA